MDLTYGPEYNAFRAEVKAFVAANIDEQPKPGDGPRSPAVRAWQAKLIANGYHSRTIPEAY
ncbi:MAG TPA: acyl-CoA dehydrogenase, partial [Gammaproteobacteria bacterium]|nr:acyl-CoA dehydrogenase [Gammaproteobacteria bacterium]